MANLHLITGKGTSTHIGSADDGSLNAAVFGSGTYILNRGNKAAITVISNNQVKIDSGDLLCQGRHIRINSPITLNIDNGSSGNNRTDLIAVRYTRNASSGVEEANLEVIKGTPTTGSAVFPDYNTGDILDGSAASVDFPIYAIYITGINLSNTKQLASMVTANISNAISASDLGEWAKQPNKPNYTAQEVGAAAASHQHSVSQITAGILGMARGGTASATGDGALKNFLAAGATILSANQYGTTLPPAGQKGRIFFLKK